METPMNTTTSQDQTATFADLLHAAVRGPGKIHTAYFAFHGYSIGNQLLALIQCAERGIAPGPIASFNKWKERGRFVRKGQRAIALWMPITCKRTIEQEPGRSEETAFTRFLLKRNWFVLAQTDGREYGAAPIPSWDHARALPALGIEQIAFDHTDGNVWGFARGKQIAASPLSPMPDRTLLHEIAHVVLGHTAESIEQDGPRTPRSIREVEAEGVAFLCSAALGLDGAQYSRG
jgi:N-terminal domain of anti-restriction factor ArdC